MVKERDGCCMESLKRHMVSRADASSSVGHRSGRHAQARTRTTLGWMTVLHTAASLMICFSGESPPPCLLVNNTVLTATSRLRHLPRYTVPKPPVPIGSSSCSWSSSFDCTVPASS